MSQKLPKFSKEDRVRLLWTDHYRAPGIIFGISRSHPDVKALYHIHFDRPVRGAWGGSHQFDDLYNIGEDDIQLVSNSIEDGEITRC